MDQNPGMGPREWIALIAVVVAVLSLYWAELRRARLSQAAIRWMRIVVPRRGNPQLMLSLAISNSGARSGVIDYLSLRLYDKKQGRILEEFYAASDGIDATWDFGDNFQSVPRAFAVDAGSTWARDVWFISDDPDFTFRQGTFEIQLRAKVAGREEEVRLQRQTVRFVRSIPRNYDVLNGALKTVEELVFK